MLCKAVICTLLCNTLIAESLPQTTLNIHKTMDSFQNSVQQQTFQSVLVAIEERLRNLDNIYSMQLSETIKSKLDQYHRKLESLDTKIIRLESLVMLNLNKIAENISTKDYKDDIAVTQAYRKLDNMYNGLSHRISYMDRKSDMAFDKLQNKIDTTLLRIEKMEENMMQRSSDVEAEALFLIEDFKTASVSAEQSLLNITTIINQTISNAPIMNSIKLSIQNLIMDVNQSVAQRLGTLETTSLRSLNISEENNSILKSMKVELKEDFNEYANKVADMNADIWKLNDIADESLKTIETVTNSTRIEVQNGVRSLILQIGKLPGKGNMNNDKTSLESLKKSVNLSLEKIITNQELFLESCHRVQMDESQIESEISVMLGKLIDMLEKKMTTVMKDLKSLEKTLKNHDSRTTRNIYQANTNIVNLFEKTIKNSETTEKELQEIKFYINSLFTLVQDVLPKSVRANGVNQNAEILELSENITNLIKSINNNNDIQWAQVERKLTKYNDISEKINYEIKDISAGLLNIQYDNNKTLSSTIGSFIEEVKNIASNINKTFSVACTKVNASNITVDSTRGINNPDDIKKGNCSQNYGDLIDLRANAINCYDNVENSSLFNNENIEPQEYVLNETHSNEATFKTTTTPRPQDDEVLKKAILDIFGKAPLSTKVNTSNITVDSTRSINNPDDNKKGNCSQNYGDLIDLRANAIDCYDNVENSQLHNNENIEPQANIINETHSNEETFKTNTSPRPQDDEILKKAILDIFGTAPLPVVNVTTENTMTTVFQNKNTSIPAWANLLNIRMDNNASSEDINLRTTSFSKGENRKKVQSRLNVDDTLEYEDSTEYTEDYLTTDSSTETNMPSTKMPILELKDLEQATEIV